MLIKPKKRFLSELRKELAYARKNGYTLEDMIKGIWLSNWSSNTIPDFALFHHHEPSDIVGFV